MPKRYRWLLILLLLPALLIACGAGQTTPLADKVPVSPEAADRLAQKLEAAVNRDDDTFSLEFTDDELTSYVALKLAQPGGRAVQVPLEDFQARFSGGQMIFSGQLTSVCPFRLGFRLKAAAQVEDGRLDVRLDEARLGIVSLPRPLLKGLSRIVTETIVEAPLHLSEAVEVADLEIGQGVVRVGGRMTENSGQ